MVRRRRLGQNRLALDTTGRITRDETKWWGIEGWLGGRQRCQIKDEKKMNSKMQMKERERERERRQSQTRVVHDG